VALSLFFLGFFVYAALSALFFAALERIPATIASFLLYVYPLFVILFGWIQSKTRPAVNTWIATALSLVGIALILQPGFASTGTQAFLDPTGVIFALGSGMCLALYVVLSERLVRSSGALVSTTWITLGTAISFTAIAAVTDAFDTLLTASGIQVLLAMAFFSTVVGLGAFLAGTARVGATTASLLSTLEPFFTAILAALVLHETFVLIQIIGGGAILAGITLLHLHRGPPGR
jgi:drug/metabolite transporter (DMT)-like permease